MFGSKKEPEYEDTWRLVAFDHTGKKLLSDLVYPMKDQKLVDSVVQWCRKEAAARKESINKKVVADKKDADKKLTAERIADRKADLQLTISLALEESVNKLTESIKALAKTVPDVVLDDGAGMKGGEAFESGTVIMTSEYKKEITAEGTKVFQKAENGEWVLIDSEKRE